MMPLPAEFEHTALENTSKRLSKTISLLCQETNLVASKRLKSTSSIVGRWTALNLHTFSTTKAVLKYAENFLPSFVYFENKMRELKGEFISLTILYENDETQKSINKFEELYFTAIKELNSIHSLSGVSFREFNKKMGNATFRVNRLIDFTSHFLLRMLHDIAIQSAQNDPTTKRVPDV